MISEEDDKVRQRLILIDNSKNERIPEDTIPRFNRKQRQVLTLLSFGDFACFCALSIMAPLFPAEASRKEMSTTVSGLVFGVYAFVLFIVSPFMGALVGRIEAKVLLVQGLGLVGYSNILFGFANLISSSQLDSFAFYTILLRIMTALGAAAYTASSYMIISDHFPEDVGTALASMKVGVGFGITLGPAIGGALFDVGGFGLPFFLLGALVLLIIPLCLGILPMSRVDVDSIEKQSFCSLWHLFSLHPSIILISFTITIIASTWSFLEPILEPHLRRFDLPPTQVGLFFMLSSGFFAMCSPLVGYTADKMTRTWILIVIGLLSSTIALLLLGPSVIVGLENTVWINIIALGLLGMSISMALLPTFEALLDFAIKAGCKDGLATYGLVGGLWASMYSLGEVIGPVLGAFLNDILGFVFCTSVFAAFTLIAAISVIVHFGIEKREKLKPDSDTNIENPPENQTEQKTVTE